MNALHLPGWLLVAALASLLGCGGEASLPNVMIVLMDTTRADHLEPYGYPRATSPFLGQMAERSVVFENAFSSSSSTAPATSSLFTGYYPRDHGVTQGFFAHRREVKILERSGEAPLPLNRLPAGLRTLPEQLQDLGYRGFGLGANINIGDEIGFSRGFQRFEKLHRAGADVLERQLLEWEDEMRDGESPWFAYLHFNDPHEPYDAMEPWAEDWTPEGDEDDNDVRMARYDSEIRFVDEALARLWSRLDDGGRTLFVLVTDHGEEFGEHGGRGHGFTLYGELNRVALMVHPPGGLSEPRRVATPVSLVDVLPTLRELLGQAPDPELPGLSLAAFVRGEAPSEDRASALASRPLFAHKVRRHKGVRWITAVIQDGWKLIERSDTGPYLFHLREDPGEKTDLAERQPERRKRLQEVLEGYREAEPRFAPTGAGAVIDREQLDHLRALGYVDP